MRNETSHHVATSDLPSGLVVMMVEPQRFLSGILRSALVSAGVYSDNILEVRTATKALEILKTKIPDVILTEINLPDTSGEFMIRKVRQRGIDVPIMAITADATEFKVREALDAGVTDFLVKPVSQLLVSKRILRQIQGPPPKRVPANDSLSGFSLQ